MTALTCRHLSYTRTETGGRGPADVLVKIDAAFAPGTLTLICGPTGAGKTTLLHLLAGLLRPTAGEVRWGDQAVSRWHAAHKDRWRRQVGILFQHQRLLGDLTAGENVILPLIPRKISLKDQAVTVERALRRVGLGDKADRPAARLSGGERQRLALARAIAVQPALLLADEPSAFQDDARTAELMALLRAEKARGAVVIVCTHDPRLRAAADVDRRYFLERGRLETER